MPPKAGSLGSDPQWSISRAAWTRPCLSVARKHPRCAAQHPAAPSPRIQLALPKSQQSKAKLPPRFICPQGKAQLLLFSSGLPKKKGSIPGKAPRLLEMTFMQNTAAA